jgi:multiple sugar transport system substrate-binding protein
MSGEWSPGTYISSENELAQLYRLSRPSVRKALSELAEDGLIRTLHGIGSVVNEAVSAPKTLQLFWGMPSYEFNAVTQLVDKYNSSNTRVRVEIVQAPKDALRASVQDGFAIALTRPDMISMSNTFFHQLTGETPDGLLRPLQLEGLQDFYDPYIRAFTCNGQVFGAPVTFAPIVLVYNKTMFDHLGLPYPDEAWTWGELLEAALALTHYDGHQAECYGFSFSSSLNRWPLFVLQNGGVFSKGDELLSDDQATKEALQFMVDLMYKHKVSPIFSTSNFRSGEMLFLRAKIGMILTSYVFFEEFHDMDFEWDFIRMPRQVTETGLGLATGIGICSTCQNVKEAEQFIEYMMSEEAQRCLKKTVCSIPTRRSIAENREDPYYPLPGKSYYVFESFADHTRTVADFGLTKDQINDLNKELELVWVNVSSVDEVWNSLRLKWSGTSGN